MHYLFLLAILCVTFFSSITAVFACSCDPSTIEDRYKTADIVLEGLVLDNSFSECSVKTRLRVGKTYKGLVGNEIQITGGRCTSCDRNLDTGKKYVVFAQTRRSGNLEIDFCGGTELIRETGGQPDTQAFLDQRRQQSQLLDKLISTKPDNKEIFMKTKAEHLLYWEDDQQAEIVLNDIIKSKGRDDWAADELMGVWLRMRKAQEIWDFKDKPSGKKSNDARNFAAFVLGKELGSFFILRLENMLFEKIEHPKVKFRMPTFSNIKIIDSNFSGAEFPSAHIEGSHFSNIDFSHVLFVDATIQDSFFEKIDLNGADLTGSKILNSQFLNSNLKSAILSGVDLSGSSFDCATQWPDGFDPAAAGAKLIQKCQ